MTTDPVSLLNVTRDQAALRGFDQAVERIRGLEREIEATFAQLQAAVENCKENGLEVMVRLEKPADAAFAAWKNYRYTADD